jgi:hypothetical protein
VDKQALAHLQRRLREDRVVRGREDLGDAARLGPVEAVGHGHRLALVHGGELGLAAAADDRHHAIARAEPLGARPARDDLAGELEAGDIRRRARRRRVQAAPLHHVGAVDAGRLDADEDLARPGLGVGVVLDAELLVADRDGAHGAGVKHLGAADAARSITA